MISFFIRYFHVNLLSICIYNISFKIKQQTKQEHLPLRFSFQPFLHFAFVFLFLASTLSIRKENSSLNSLPLSIYLLLYGKLSKNIFPNTFPTTFLIEVPFSSHNNFYEKYLPETLTLQKKKQSQVVVVVVRLVINR